MNNLEKFLPIGTVCSLKETKKRVMIVGFLATSPTINNEVKDYIGCIYPEGIISSDTNLLFNHNDIDKVFYMGYSDEEEKKVQEKLQQVDKEIIRMTNDILYNIDYPFVKIHTPADDVTKNLINAAIQS